MSATVNDRTSPASTRIAAAGIDHRADGGSARAADRALLACTGPSTLDTTHFDTVRFPVPDWAVERFAAAAADGALAYTTYPGSGDVRGHLAGPLTTWFGHDVDAADVMLTPGTQAGLFTTLSGIVDPGDRVALVDPDYLFSERILTFLGAQVTHVPLVRRTADAPELAPDLDRLDAAFRDGVRLLGMRERTITLLGPSKTESLSGYRLGVVVGPRPILSAAEDVLSLTALRAPAYAQHVLKGWLTDDVDWVADRIQQLQGLRAMTIKHFSQLPWIGLVPQQGTAYLFPDVTALRLPDRTISEALATRADVLISPGYQFGPAGTGHFRVCYARDEQVWDRALGRIVDVLDALYRTQAA